MLAAVQSLCCVSFLVCSLLVDNARPGRTNHALLYLSLLLSCHNPQLSTLTFSSSSDALEKREDLEAVAGGSPSGENVTAHCCPLNPEPCFFASSW